MKIRPKQFRVRPGEKVDLGDLKTRAKPVYTSKQHYETLLRNSTRDLSRAQGKLYASDMYALLLIFQAMDAAGKDSTIKHVMSGVNPQGCQVFSFKHPSAEDLDHDFLWRTNLCLPERGRIGIFNRSYYEEVLVVRVHPEILEAQRLPERPRDDEEFWRARYRSIVEMENHLCRNGTCVIKFFLHLSKEEQRKRFLERIDDPDKNWKFSAGDVTERSFWKKYMKAYEACLSATSTKQAPWYIVPADDKQNAQLIVSTIILDTLSELGLAYPKTDARRERELLQSRRRLLAEGSGN
jgi:PPK2 family polyphosphate:nucleotide phosphotransferase